MRASPLTPRVLRGRCLAIMRAAGGAVTVVCAYSALGCASGSQDVAALRATAAAASRCPDVPAAPRSAKLTTTPVSDEAALGALTVSGAGAAVIRGGRLASIGSGSVDIPLPADVLPSVALDDDGNAYVATVSSLIKLDDRGREVWERQTEGPLRSVWVLGRGADQRVGAVYRDRRESQTFTPSGEPAGRLGVFGDSFGPGAAGGLVATDDGRYVRVFDARGKLTLSVGAATKDNDPSPAGAPQHFYQLGGAAQLPDGRLLVADTQRGLMLLSRGGLLQGSLAPQAIDPAGLTQQAGPVVDGQAVYVATGPRFTDKQRVTRVALADVLARTTHGEAGEDPRLGFGAGIRTNRPGGYARAGQQLVLRATFDATWRRQRGVELCYTIRTPRTLRRDPLQLRRDGGGVRVPVTRLGGVAGGVKLKLPSNLVPGPYEVVARLVRGDRALSATSLLFSVGARGQELDFAGLPPGADFGGSAPARGVALAGQLGTGTHRVQLDWRKLMPRGPAGAVDVSAYAQPLADAAAEAKRRGVTLEVQVADGSPIEKALVENGTWEKRVEEVVSELKDPVDVWEAWNEPNNTFGAAPAYVSKVLEPFHRAVKRSDPDATVIGGSTLGVALGYWTELIRAGGLQHLDVAGVHPYTGHNRSWEEDGTVEQLTKLQGLLVKDDRSVPIWNTEHSWWSDGPFNLLAQADNSSRAMLWMKALGIEKWAYFIPEGGFGNDGVTFSAIESNDYVKPAALALMTTSAQLRGRPFLERLDTGAPSTYAMRFGPRSGDPQSGELLVAWTEGLALRAVVTPDAPGRQVVRTDTFGARRTIDFRGAKTLVLDSDPAFLAVKGQGRLEIAPLERFGPNVAAASAGASAAASSALNPPGAAIDGEVGAASGGDLAGLPMWASAKDDRERTLTVKLAAPTTIDRILVASHSVGSVVTGLRDYDVEIQAANGGSWSTVERRRGQFHRRQLLVRFPPQPASAIRIKARGVNFSGYAGGAKPPFWPVGDEGNAIIAEVRAYAPGGG